MPFVNVIKSASAAPATDPFFSNVVLLCGFNGVDAATSTTDECGRHTVSMSAGAQLDTGQFKFGSASAQFDGSNDYLEVTGNLSDFLFGTGQFTVETFLRFDTGFGAGETIMGKWSFSNSAQNAWFFDRSGGALRFIAKNASVSVVSGAWSASTGVWYHVAVDRDGANKIRIYIDGAMVGSTTNAADINETGASLGIGSMADSFGAFNPLNGWLDEVRITKGVARYASDSGYIVPTAEFPRS